VAFQRQVLEPRADVVVDVGDDVGGWGPRLAVLVGGTVAPAAVLRQKLLLDTHLLVWAAGVPDRMTAISAQASSTARGGKTFAVLH